MQRPKYARSVVSDNCPFLASWAIQPLAEETELPQPCLLLILGGLGVHKFYLGNIKEGIIYLLFCWTFIPAVVGFIEGIIYLTMSDDAFERKYG